MATMTASIQVTPYAHTAEVFIDFHIDGVPFNNEFAIGVCVKRSDMMNDTIIYGYRYQKSTFYMHYTGDGTLTFVLYPLPSNETFTIDVYYLEDLGTNPDRYATYPIVASTTITTNRIKTDASYIEIKKVKTNSTLPALTEAQKEHNVELIAETLFKSAWTDQSIACICAFADLYGGLNPAININYLMPFALASGSFHSGAYNNYVEGGTNSTYSYWRWDKNGDQFGKYGSRWTLIDGEYQLVYMNSGDNNVIDRPWIMSDTDSQSFVLYDDKGRATNPYIQSPKDCRAIPVYSGYGNVANASACIAFLPIYKQHFIDVMDKFSPTKWWATNAAFSLEQFIQYLEYNRYIQDDYLKIFNDEAPLITFNDFTLNVEEVEILVIKLYNSINKTLMYSDPEHHLYSRYSSYVCDILKRYYGSNNLPALARKWYEYVKKLPHIIPSKKRKMPIWEYLRYTI